jgi:hypothetical protein
MAALVAAQDFGVDRRCLPPIVEQQQTDLRLPPRRRRRGRAERPGPGPDVAVVVSR